MKRTFALATLAATLSCSTRGGPMMPIAPGPLRFEIAVEHGGASITVDERVPPGLGDALVVERSTGRFLRDVSVEHATGGWEPAALEGGRLVLPGCDARGCRVKYRFAADEAASALADLDYAIASDGVFEAPPSSFMLRPDRATEARFELHVTTAPGVTFATGLPRGAAADTYEASVTDLANAPFTAFGDLRTTELAVAGGTVSIAIGRGRAAGGDEHVLAWVKRAAEAIVAYYGAYPMRRALVLVLPKAGDRIGPGMTMGDGGTTIAVGLGADVTEEQLARDWILTHEMVHLTLPTLERNHHWLEEGLATYVEPLARVRAGQMRAEKVWGDLVDGLPNGLPGPGDRGLDRTPTWGRTYWGGALFCLLADLEIRRSTKGARSLGDALRAIVKAGGNGSVRWPIDRVLAVGDEAIGVPVLRPLYDKMARDPAPINLRALFQELGVGVDRGRVIFEDAAPSASFRRAIAN